MSETDNSATDINIQKTQPDATADINDPVTQKDKAMITTMRAPPPHSGDDDSSLDEPNKSNNSETVTIKQFEYNALVTNSRLLVEIMTHIDNLINNQKRVVTIGLNQQVLFHNSLADLEGIKDSILNKGHR